MSTQPHQQPQPQGDEDHLAVPQAPTQAHMANSASVDRSLSFQPQQDMPRGRTTSFFTPPKIANHNRSNPGSRATSRSRASRPNSRPSSRPASRPVSWLVHANSDYTSMYEHFGGTRSRRNSVIGADDSVSAAEKGALSRSSSFVRAGGELNEKLTRPAMGSRVSTYIQEDNNSIDSEETPVKGNVSALKASLLLLKAFVGTGVLFLPNAFKNGGILFSCLTLVAVAIICCFAFLLLVKVRLVVRESFQDIGLALYGKWMRLTILVAVTLSQIGFVCAYMIFVSENLSAVVQTFTKCQFHGITEKYYILIPLVVLIPLVLIRRMSILSLPSMLANLFIIFGIVYLWYYSINDLVHYGPGPNIRLFNQDDFALFIGTAVFSYEGIGLIIPITESMAEPEKFPRVLAITMTIVTLIFGSVGALCYSSFGDQIQTIVLLNLPVRGGMTITVELLYSLAIILSIPLQLSPASKILEHGIFGEKSGAFNFRIKMLKNALRTVLVCTCALIAFGIGGANLDKFVSFVGSVACMPLCFIFPAMFHYKIAKTRNQKIGDIILGVFGVVVMIFTLYITVRSWVVPAAPGASIDQCAVFASA